jgi:hypothetical protein
MTPDTGFYWIVKNDVIQIQAYYQGRTANEPMRCKGVAFGGKMMMGCKFVIRHNTNTLMGLQKEFEAAGDKQTSVCFCKGECKAADCTVDAEEVNMRKRCDESTAADQQLARPADGTSMNVPGGEVFYEKKKSGKKWKVHAWLPMHIYFHNSMYVGGTSYMDVHKLYMPKVPGDWDGQCGNWDTDANNDRDKGAGDAWGIKNDEADINMFLSQYTGVNGAGVPDGEGATTMEDCDPAVAANGKEICDMMFGDTEEPVCLAYIAV